MFMPRSPVPVGGKGAGVEAGRRAPVGALRRAPSARLARAMRQGRGRRAQTAKVRKQGFGVRFIKAGDQQKTRGVRGDQRCDQTDQARARREAGAPYPAISVAAPAAFTARVSARKLPTLAVKAR